MDEQFNRLLGRWLGYTVGMTVLAALSWLLDRLLRLFGHAGLPMWD